MCIWWLSIYSYFCLFLLSFSLKWLRHWVQYIFTMHMYAIQLHRCTDDTPWYELTTNSNVIDELMNSRQISLSVIVRMWCRCMQRIQSTKYIPDKPLHNDTVWVHFNHLYCMEICNKLRRNITILTYIWLNANKCLLQLSMPQKRIKSKCFSIKLILNNWRFSWCVVDGHVRYNVVGVQITLFLPYSINNE